MGLGPHREKLPPDSGGELPLLLALAPLLDAFVALGIMCPTWGGSFRGRSGSSDLGGEEGLGIGQWGWAPSINRKPWCSGLVASPSAANLSAPTSL